MGVLHEKNLLYISLPAGIFKLKWNFIETKFYFELVIL